MKHLLLCREYPPAPSGGIGTYAVHMSRLLAEAGETVHVIGRRWKGADQPLEELCNGRLIVHRVQDRHPEEQRHGDSAAGRDLRGLLKSNFPQQSFGWMVTPLIERLVEQDGIDIIECQDYQAPLYFFQLRRAVGLGPRHTPPCIIHLHSPLELIVQPDDGDIQFTYMREAERLERYSIAAADALLCPSRFLAQQLETHYGLNAKNIQIIPLPLGDGQYLKRLSETWSKGSICFIGRLEPRKGILEWIDAAIAVTEEFPDATFDFIGNAERPYMGVLSMRGVLDRRIPDGLKHRFRILGPRPRIEVLEHLRRARIAVVPSRWENFPNTCVEAMASGLPIIATREGGMVEMLEEDRTGWLAASPTSAALEATLRRALQVSAKDLESMGSAASEAIRKLCDNEAVLEQQMEFRHRVIRQGAVRSLRLPVNLPWSRAPIEDPAERSAAVRDAADNVAIVIRSHDSRNTLDATIKSVKNQTRLPAVVVVVDDGSKDVATCRALARAEEEGITVLREPYRGAAGAKNTGIRFVLGGDQVISAFTFLEAGDRLRPRYVETCSSVLSNRPEVGVVSFWVIECGMDQSLFARPCPAFPYQWVVNDAVGFSMIRTAALHQAGMFRFGLHEGYEDWDLVGAAMVNGWVAVTLPETLGETNRNRKPLHPTSQTYSAMHKAILHRHVKLFEHDAVQIVELAVPHARWSLTQTTRTQGARVKRVKALARNTIQHVLSCGRMFTRHGRFRR